MVLCLARPRSIGRLYTANLRKRKRAGHWMIYRYTCKRGNNQTFYRRFLNLLLWILGGTKIEFPKGNDIHKIKIIISAGQV